MIPGVMAGGMRLAAPAAGVEIVATAISNVDSASSSARSASIPAGSVGDLLIVFATMSGSASQVNNLNTYTSGWSRSDVAAGNTATVSAVFWKIAEGSDVLTITPGGTSRSTMLTYRVAGADSVAVNISTQGSTANPDPQTVTISTAEDALFIAAISWRAAGTWSTSEDPSGYSEKIVTNTNSGNAYNSSIVSLSKIDFVTTEDPTPFTWNLSGQVNRFTVAAYVA